MLRLAVIVSALIIVVITYIATRTHDVDEYKDIEYMKGDKTGLFLKNNEPLLPEGLFIPSEPACKGGSCIPNDVELFPIPDNVTQIALDTLSPDIITQSSLNIDYMLTSEASMNSGETVELPCECGLCENETSVNSNESIEPKQ